jgi:TPR repeat protein
MKHTIKSFVFGLSLLLANGSVVYAQDYEKGVEAAKKGDYATALRELRPLAEQGNADAQSNVGWMYNNGEGVTQNYKEAVKWYRLAAELGNAYAQINLGTMYAYGQGVMQNNVYAHMWFNIAASNGNVTALKNRNILTRKMMAADISKAQDLARACVQKNLKAC